MSIIINKIKKVRGCLDLDEIQEFIELSFAVGEELKEQSFCSLDDTTYEKYLRYKEHLKKCDLCLKFANQYFIEKCEKFAQVCCNNILNIPDFTKQLDKETRKQLLNIKQNREEEKVFQRINTIID